MNIDELIAGCRARLAAAPEDPANDPMIDYAVWGIETVPLLLDALEVARARVDELGTVAIELLAAHRRIAELEAAQRPPLGYVVGRQASGGWNFLRWYGGPDEIRAGAEQDLANALEEDGPGLGWQLLEVREVPGCAI